MTEFQPWFAFGSESIQVEGVFTENAFNEKENGSLANETKELDDWNKFIKEETKEWEIKTPSELYVERLNRKLTRNKEVPLGK